MAIGVWIGWFLVTICWNFLVGRPTHWIPRKNAWCSLITGFGYGCGHASYMASAKGLHASVLAPLSSLYILVPPIIGLFQGKRITPKIAFGFCCSIVCLLLLSGWIKSGPSDPITQMDWLLLGVMIMGWGIGILSAEPAGRGLDELDFPMSQFFYTLAYLLSVPVAFLFAKINGVRLTDTSLWFPVEWPQVLVLLSAGLGGVGTGFFTLTMSDSSTSLNLMAGMTSLYIAIPAILGLLFLKDPVEWNILLGIACACIGTISFSLELQKISNAKKTEESLPLLNETISKKRSIND